MEKLKLEHLAPYLPYGLKVAFIVRDEIRRIDIIRSLYDIENYDDIKLSIGYSDGEHIWMYKPILRPLSDLTKEIEHDGEEFVPQKKIPQLEFEWLITSEKPYELVQTANYEHFIKLLEWHFDVFGLIDKGLAIDINTI